MAFDPKHNSRTITDGPTRAAARSYYYSIGFTKEDIAEADRRHRQHLDRHDAVQLQPAPARREGRRGRAQGRRHADGVQHHRHQRRHHHGHRGHEDLAHLARADRRLDRALHARLHVRRARLPRRLRQDDPGGVDGARAAQHPRHHRLRRLDPARHVTRAATSTSRTSSRASAQNAAGTISDEELDALEHAACPGPGACGGQFTANTMALAMEFIGLSPMGSASVPAVDPRKDDVGVRAGEIVMDVLRRNQRPLDILTREAFENAIAGVAATGGSTNAVLHLLALAREANVPLTIDDFDTVSDRTPLIADLQPGGRYLAADLDKAGGVQLVAKRLVEGGYMDGTQATPSGRTLAEEAALRRRDAGPGRRRRRSSSRSRRPAASSSSRATSRPKAASIKVAGHERLTTAARRASSTARKTRCTPSPRARIKPGDVVVIRYEGPKGGPGMREMLGVTSRHRRRGPGRDGRAAHRRPLQRRHARPDGRPRRARGVRRRPDRRHPRRRHHLASTSRTAASTSSSRTTRSPRACATGAPPSRATRPASWRSTPRSCRARAKARSRGAVDSAQSSVTAGTMVGHARSSVSPLRTYMAPSPRRRRPRAGR